MKAARADVSKIAAYCETENDALRLLKILLNLRDERRRCIILGMGVHGAVTRLFGTLWGNEMIFAPESRTKASAPGQLTRSELEQCFSALQTLLEEQNHDCR
jgi:3-dehydroquinate dehydratase type I